MDRESIIANLAIQTAIKQCKDSTPSAMVDAYFSVLPEVRKCFEEHEKKQVSTPKAQFFSANKLEI